MGHRQIQNRLLYVFIVLGTHACLTSANHVIGSSGTSKQRLLIKLKSFYDGGRRPLQIIVPLKNHKQSVGMLLRSVNERVRSRYHVNVVELRLNGSSLYEQDIIVDVIDLEKAETLFVIEAIWVPIQNTLDQPSKKSTKTQNVIPAENPCEKWHGCPNCTIHKNCMWCSSVNKCLHQKLGHLCPIRLPSKHCLDFNLKQQRQTFLRPCRRWSRWDAPFYGGVCCGDGKCKKDV